MNNTKGRRHHEAVAGNRGNFAPDIDVFTPKSIFGDKAIRRTLGGQGQGHTDPGKRAAALQKAYGKWTTTPGSKRQRPTPAEAHRKTRNTLLKSLGIKTGVRKKEHTGENLPGAHATLEEYSPNAVRRGLLLAVGRGHDAPVGGR